MSRVYARQYSSEHTNPRAHGHGQQIDATGCGESLLPGLVVVEMHVPRDAVAVRRDGANACASTLPTPSNGAAAVWRVAVLAPSETDLDVGRARDLAKHEWNDRCPPLPCIGDGGALARRRQVRERSCRPPRVEADPVADTASGTSERCSRGVVVRQQCHRLSPARPHGPCLRRRLRRRAPRSASARVLLDGRRSHH
jgi:hypothetical protein